MKLLLDQNISYKLISKLNKLFPGTNHVSRLGLDKASDLLIWNYAKDNNFILVTQDADFYELALLRGFPPKIIYLRCKDSSTKNIIKVITENFQEIEEFNNNEQYACIELY
jgi:predicted nuclease of predicted toxin-antitoxin system